MTENQRLSLEHQEQYVDRLLEDQEEHEEALCYESDRLACRKRPKRHQNKIHHAASFDYLRSHRVERNHC